MVSLMSFLDGCKYDSNTLFPEERIIEIQPEDIARWMWFKVVGDPTPNIEALIHAVEDKVTTLRIRSSTLQCMKKGVSAFMPHDSPWNVLAKYGNPTKSRVVNTVLGVVSKLEASRHGKESCAKRALGMDEFRTLLRMVESKYCLDFESCCRTVTMLKLQYHLVARSDDITKFLTKDLRSHSNHLFSSFTLQTRVTWSKNVREERDCPDQLLMGSDDPDYCILLSLSVYLETWMIVGKGLYSELLFGDDKATKTSVNKLKNRYRGKLKAVFKSEEFKKIFKNANTFGTHSLRKYPATFARKCNCTVADIDVRGRWKRNGGKVVDRYIDVKQEYVDGKVAAALCVGGPVKYELVDGCGLSNDWLREKVVPGISRYYGDDDDNKNALVLALPLLWIIFDAKEQKRVPEWLIVKIMGEYEAVRKLDVGVNPVR
jgi:hypothetical protein